MTLWLLRLFRQFRDLETLAVMQARAAERAEEEQRRLTGRIDSLEQSATVSREETDSLHEDITNLQQTRDQLIAEKVLLEDRLTAALQEKDRLWESTNRALDGERYALHTMVNHATQKNGGGTPYPDAHTLPPSEVRQVQRPGPIGRSARMLPSEIAARETARFIDQFVHEAKTEKAA